jgi:hypothetical protein
MVIVAYDPSRNLGVGVDVIEAVFNLFKQPLPPLDCDVVHES